MVSNFCEWKTLGCNFPSLLICNNLIDVDNVIIESKRNHKHQKGIGSWPLVHVSPYIKVVSSYVRERKRERERERREKKRVSIDGEE